MTKLIKDYVWRLCSDCSVRNCKREPKIRPDGTYMCRKRIEYHMTNSMLELVIESSTKEIMEILHQHGLKIVEGKNGLRLVRKELNDGCE